MGATPVAGHPHDGDLMPKVRRTPPPVGMLRRETAVWAYLVHPSLLPTVFAPSGGTPAVATAEEVAARKV